jgi:hypothetical protein
MSSAKVGNFNGVATINAQGGNATIALTGAVQNNLLIQTTPLGLDFGAVGVGDTLQQTIQLTNTASSPFSLTGLSFSIPDFTETDNCQGQIAVGASCTMTVSFNPQQLGLRRAGLTLGVSISSLTSVVSIAGSGSIPLTASPVIVNFGSANFVSQASAPQQVMLQNSTSAPSAYTLNASSGFGVSNTCANPLPAGTSCAVGITMSATAAGTQQGTLTISYPGTSLISTVSLTGSATDALVLQAAPGQSLSGSVNSGSTATYQLRSIAAAGFNGSVQMSCSGAPQYANCSISPSSFMAAGASPTNITVTVTTNNGTATGMRLTGTYPLLAAVLLMFVFVPAGRKGTGTYFTIAVLALAFAITGCGGGGGANSGGGGGGTAPQNTPSGTYTLTVTATSGNVSQSLPLTLVVK